MISLVTGLFAFGLTVWPVVVLQWAWHTHQQGGFFQSSDGVLLILVSLLAGCITAICGAIFPDEDASTLRFFGRAFCIMTFCIEGVIVIWLIHGFAQFSHWGVN
jgi:hypothetical protein